MTFNLAHIGFAESQILVCWVSGILECLFLVGCVTREHSNPISSGGIM